MDRNWQYATMDSITDMQNFCSVRQTKGRFVSEAARILKSSSVVYIKFSAKHQQYYPSAVLTFLQQGFEIDSDLDLT